MKKKNRKRIISLLSTVLLLTGRMPVELNAAVPSYEYDCVEAYMEEYSEAYSTDDNSEEYSSTESENREHNSGENGEEQETEKSSIESNTEENSEEIFTGDQSEEETESMEQPLNPVTKTIEMTYGETLDLSEYAEKNLQQEGALYSEQMEIVSKNTDKLKVNGNLIRAVGVTEDPIMVSIKYLADDHLLESEEAKIPVIIHQVTPEVTMRLQQNTSWQEAQNIYIHEELALHASIIPEGDDYGDLMLKDANLKVQYRIIHEPSGTSTEYIKTLGQRKEPQERTFDEAIAVSWQYFFRLHKGEKYRIEMAVIYTGTDCPYKLPVKQSCELTLQAANAYLRTDKSLLETTYREMSGSKLEIPFELMEKRLGIDSTVKEPKELEQIRYEVSTSDPMVVSVDETAEYRADTVASVPVTIRGAGEACVQVRAEESPTYDIEEMSVKVIVNNSGMKEEDYCFRYAQDGTQTDFKPAEWKQFLKESQYWLNEPFSIVITGEGKKYYDTIGYQSEKAQIDTKNKGSVVVGEKIKALPVSDYTLWMENKEKNASTRGVEGEPSFQWGIDRESPQLVEIQDNQDSRYQVTSNDKIWYMGESYVLNGTYEDRTSGIERLEYTTDGGKQWKELSSDNSTDIHVRKFALCLDNGTYTGIAVRAVDLAGNVSEEYRLVNKEDNYIKMTVDTRIPKAEIQVSKNTKNHPMEGTQDWTRYALNYKVLEKKDNPVIYRTYYQYVPIQQVYEREQKGESPYQEEEWQELPAEGFTVGAVDDEQEPVNRNGTYYFKMVSMCGLESKVVSKEIKLQQTLPDIMEAVITHDRQEAWYHAGTPLPAVTFPYEDYLEGCVTKEEYQAPITIHRTVTSRDGKEERSATVGFTSKAAYEAYCQDGVEYTKAAYDSKVKELEVSFEQKGDDKYLLSYWIEDAAGNRSKTVTHPFNIDTTMPDSLQVWLDGREHMTGMSENIVYDTFSREAIQGKASAQDNLSGIRSVQILKAKKFGEWKENLNLEEGESFMISPCTRCFLYVVAEDEAGNQAYAWTNGIVVDDKAPEGFSGRGLVLEPEGGNADGFHKEDVTVNIDVQDMPQNDDYAALDTVSCVISSEGKEESRVLYQAATTAVSEEELSRSGTFQTKVLLDAALYEGNDTCIEVTAKDRAGNVTASTQLMKIDVTCPQVEITFDGEEPVGDRFYRKERTATIHIRERNFNEKLVEIEVTRNGEPYDIAPTAWTGSGNEYNTTLFFTEDGDYTLSVRCKDLADNESEVAIAEPFTIDRTAPAIEISYEGEAPYKENYYNAARTALITVTEHNFDAKDFHVDTMQEYLVNSWIHEGDIHRLRIHFTRDDHYLWTCDYMDMAGNEAQKVVQQDFYIDTKEPLITITGVTDNSANSGEVIPVITVEEEHYNAQDVRIVLENGKGEPVNIEPDIHPSEGGLSYVLKDVNDQMDDVYYLTVKCLDMSGNAAELTYRFSLNRNGSAYDMRQARAAVSRMYYRSCDLSDIQIVEMNVDKVEKFSLYVLRNGILIPAIQADDRTKADSDAVSYKVNIQGDEWTGYTYTYTLYKESFGKEGLYHIAFYSKDAAGNEVSNTLESKDAELRFIVDDTPPKAVLDGIEDDGVYDMQEKQVNVMFTDNCKLEEAYLYLLNDKSEELGKWNYMESVKEEETLQLKIPEYSGMQTLVYKAVDAAGNELTVQGKGDLVENSLNFVITTNPWIRLTRSTGFAQIAACAAVISGCTAGGIMIVLIYRKRRIRK